MHESSRKSGEGLCDSYLIKVEYKVEFAYILKGTIKCLYENLSDVSKENTPSFCKDSYLDKI